MYTYNKSEREVFIFAEENSPKQYIFSILHTPLFNLKNRSVWLCLFVIDLGKIPEVLLLPVKSEQDIYGYWEHLFSDWKASYNH